MHDAIQFRRLAALTSRRTLLLTAAALPLLNVTLSRGEAGFAKIAKAVWVWKDRILDPGELALFCEYHRIGVLFLYLTPQAGEALRLAGALWSDLHFGRVDVIFNIGLHEYLTDFLTRTDTLGGEINRSYFTLN